VDAAANGIFSVHTPVDRLKQTLLVRIIVCCGVRERAEVEKDRNINMVVMMGGALIYGKIA
jgi:hypothetical protein